MYISDKWEKVTDKISCALWLEERSTEKDYSNWSGKSSLNIQIQLNLWDPDWITVNMIAVCSDKLEFLSSLTALSEIHIYISFYLLLKNSANAIKVFRNKEKMYTYQIQNAFFYFKEVFVREICPLFLFLFLGRGLFYNISLKMLL